MGGSIRVVVKADQVVHVQSRWTNELPFFVKNAKFFEGDRAHIDAYLRRGIADQNGTETLSPEGYGLDVFDFDARRIYSMNAYTDYDSLENANVELAIMQDPRYEAFYQELWDKQYMSLLHLTKMDKQWREPQNQRQDTCADFDFATARQRLDASEDFAKAAKSQKPFYLNYVIRWAENGWSYQSYDESVEGMKKMRADLTAAGFWLGTEGRAEWDEQIAEGEQNEADEEE